MIALIFALLYANDLLWRIAREMMLRKAESALSFGQPGGGVPVAAGYILVALFTAIVLGWGKGGTWFIFVFIVVSGMYMIGVFG